MAYYRDLDRCTYFAPECDDALVAVGWLGTWARLSSGSVDPQFFERLESLANRPWRPFLYLGGQECGLCQHRGPFFTANLFIPYGGRTFAAPEGITHYISAHWYQPPHEFVLAVHRLSRDAQCRVRSSPRGERRSAACTSLRPTLGR